MSSITAFAPATCANVAVGFDILGFAFAGVGDYVTLTPRNDQHIVIERIDGDSSLPQAVEKNVASAVVQAVCRDRQLPYGFSLQLKKGIPLGSGMGGSAASTVAALVAVNAFLDEPLTRAQLIHYALLGEEVASGHRHLDNVVACLYGGLVLVHTREPLEVVSLPLPDVYCVIVHPHLRLDTREARHVLAPMLPLARYVEQSAHLAAFIASLYQNNPFLLQRSLTDVLIEPQRAALVPGFYAVKQAAIDAGALGVSLSGSGPSLFALTRDHAAAVQVSAAMQQAFMTENIAADVWVTRMSAEGARIVEAL